MSGLHCLEAQETRSALRASGFNRPVLVALLGGLLTAAGEPAIGEIILGAAPASSIAAQSAQYNRQRAMVERSRDDNGEFRLSPNIILMDGFGIWGGNYRGGGWTGSPTGSPAAYGAAYNRQRAMVERSRDDNGEFRLSPNVIMDGSATWGGASHWGSGWTGSPTGSPAAYGAAYNRQRAIANQVFMGNKHSSSGSHRERASAYRKQDR